ncbi:DUF1304 domain-containing protein [Criblamydia sequanensis]|uniref:Conserved putative membrane protein n=1 Tax=Candidatus Criblamydia sequanensis CRIB-18 TaxID=1437425 RepID=A0A090CZ33_9BACT|nr:DUF1304 domain-containing protein [Criblamydia sequanensis]CDR34132.1 Conserved putative membrane protein [Criblamydia sequanensis CRIB-18]
MSVITQVLIGIIGVLHLYIMGLEMFLWKTAYGRKTFKMSEEKAAITAVLAKNQGLYNGFLAFGLLGSLFLEDPTSKRQVQIFLLGCVSIAGIYGSITTKEKSILLIQGLPALIALFLRQLNI